MRLELPGPSASHCAASKVRLSLPVSIAVVILLLRCRYEIRTVLLTASRSLRLTLNRHKRWPRVAPKARLADMAASDLSKLALRHSMGFLLKWVACAA